MTKAEARAILRQVFASFTTRQKANVRKHLAKAVRRLPEVLVLEPLEPEEIGQLWIDEGGEGG